MKKLSMQTPDLTENNITKIAQLFPNVITEKEGVDGVVEKAVDFELLKQALSKELVEDDSERYRLDWPGKKASLLKANTPITKTLRPDRESSVNFDTTENVFIEGDNFEVLKVLQESYLGKIKMIYIDPPYNTGSDFVYRDNFTQSREDYDDEIGSTDDEDNKLFRNTESNGRFHSDWLSMMYERLLVARDLLKEDGVIFISIDDHEIMNLRKICDEIFGEDNFVSEFIWEKKKKPSFLNKNVGKLTEYILCYVKDESKTFPFSIETTTEGKKYPINNAGNSISTLIFPKNSVTFNLKDSIVKAQDMSEGNIKTKLLNDVEIKDGKNINEFLLEGEWRYSQSTLNEILNEGDEITISQAPFRPNHVKKGGEIKKMKNCLTPNHYEMETNEDATKELIELFAGDLFDNPKPTKLIKTFIKAVTYNDKTAVVLDFFAGSGTTAHSVISLNLEDGGMRKFIAVQLKEEIDKDAEAYKAGYKYISDMSKERIRRAGKKILEENADTVAVREKPLDIGFRAYKADTTNMKDVYYHPSQVVQEDLFNLVSNIKEDRTPEDLLTQVILDLGLTLDLPIEKKELRGNAVYFVAGNALVACFDDKIDFGIVDDIATYEPLKVVFKDASFKEEQDRTNVDTRMKRLSPETIITVL